LQRIFQILCFKGRIASSGRKELKNDWGTGLPRPVDPAREADLVPFFWKVSVIATH